MDEADLIAALKEGRSEAIDELVSAYGNRLLRSAYLLGGSGADAEDLVQDTFVQAIRSIRRFRGDSALYSWLYGILLNLSRHYHRRRKRLVLLDEPPETAQDAERTAAEAGAGLNGSLARQTLFVAIQTLSPEHREIVVLRYYEDRKIEEIASILGVAKGTVKSRLHYALDALRKKIPQELNLFGP
ncbi:MAG: RNA polymerase sigma factor [Kiritimatiellae bacterium]|nr:RNA polymerase sigma factor [Kiritimatiellia bacterium]